MDNLKKKILVVEDETALKSALSEILADEGFAVFEAEDGAKGLSLAKSEHPDIILLDIFMPKMGGLEMLAELRKDAWGKNVPVVLLTNSSSAESVATALDGNVTDYLIKAEWDLADIVKKVKEKLRMSNPYIATGADSKK